MKKQIEWGNVPQWVSTICALALAGLAIYGLFFSTTSQALVAYLQSELAVRNQHIAALELRERALQLSVASAQSNLNGLAEQKRLLENQVAQLRAEQEAVSQKVKDLGSTLSKTEFSLVKEKSARSFHRRSSHRSASLFQKRLTGQRASGLGPNDHGTAICPLYRGRQRN